MIPVYVSSTSNSIFKVWESNVIAEPTDLVFLDFFLKEMALSLVDFLMA